MNFQQWIQYHNKLAKKHSPNDIYHQEEGHIFIDKDNGFIRLKYIREESAMYLTEITGNASYWMPIYLKIARDMTATKIVGFSSIKNPKVIERLFKGKVVSRTDGVYRFERQI